MLSMENENVRITGKRIKNVSNNLTTLSQKEYYISDTFLVSELQLNISKNSFSFTADLPASNCDILIPSLHNSV